MNGSIILLTNTTIGAGDKFTINAVISDGGLTNGFTKILNGTLILNANNTYSGQTIVNAGTLQCNKPGALGNYGAVTITNTGVLNLNYTGTHFVSALDLGGGNPQLPGTYGSSSSPAPSPDDTYFAGTGTVTVPGPAQIITFAVPGALSVAIDPVALTIAVTMPPRTAVTSLTPTYTLSSGSCVPPSGSTHSFTSPVTYTVTDGATVHAYTVTVIVQPSYNWAGPNGGNWSTPANWNNVMPGPSDVPVFSDTASAGATVNLDVDVTVPDLVFNNLVTNQTIASTGGKTLTLTNGNVEVQAGTLFISCPIDATQNGVNVTGGGVLNIAGPLQTSTAGNPWKVFPVGAVTLSGNGAWTTPAGDGADMNVTSTLTVNDNATVDWSQAVIVAVAQNSGEVGKIVQNGGVVKGVPVGTSWTQAAGPGLNLGGFAPGSTSEYDLNGGRLITASVYDYSGTWAGNQYLLQPPAADSPAVFRFNGGILQATVLRSQSVVVSLEGALNSLIGIDA
ncbi:MAG: autotransporter-associated beta strand repeat-containing protein [Verrucomicrobia bacterium]|nr:autotransporter-associated beta strand repeat-containing protein [Verrucomicrobiota bacterium]